jgi:hypothetical protein
MTVALTYDNTLSRVRITVSGITAAADHVLIERSTNQISWTTVRGGSTVAIAAGVATLDDYEFTPNVVNYYRASLVDTTAHSHVATGTAATSGNAAANATLSPPLPAGLVAGDAMYLMASIRNSGAGTVNTPTGWTPIITSGNVALFGRRYVSGDTAPTVSFSGAVANASVIAQIYGRRNTDIVPVTTAAQLNASAQNIAYPAATVTQDGCLGLVIGWKQDDWTSVDPLAGAAENAEIVETVGDDAGMVWDRIVQTTAANIPAGSFTVTGGLAAISRGIVAVFGLAPYVTQESATITPNLTAVWLKSLARPFLNRSVTVVDWSDVTRESRTGVFAVVGRSFPVAVTDLHGSRQWTVEVLAATAAEADAMDLLISTGEVQYVQVPAGCRVPDGYVALGDTTERRPRARATRRVFALPLTEVAAPGANVVPAVGTCQTVLNNYATCQAVLTAFATCADLLQLVGSPADVVVP